MFVSAGVLRNLVVILEPFSSDYDVVWNICRALRQVQQIFHYICINFTIYNLLGLLS